LLPIELVLRSGALRVGIARISPADGRRVVSFARRRSTSDRSCDEKAPADDLQNEMIRIPGVEGATKCAEFVENASE
jgi:hypothetical protein